MDMSCSLDVLVRQDARPVINHRNTDPMNEVVRQTREKMAAAFSGKLITASLRR